MSGTERGACGGGAPRPDAAAAAPAAPATRPPQQPSARGALDAGPTTILGERPPVVDPVVLELGRVLEEQAEKFDNGDPEVEVRLGVIRLKDLKEPKQTGAATRSADVEVRGARAELPVQTEALLAPREGFSHRFSPGMPPEVFVALSDRLDGLVSEKLPPERRMECGRTFERSEDIIYSVDGAELGLPPGKQQVRVSTSEDGTERKSRASAKLKLASLDLYSGSKPGEHGPALDLRVGLSMEAALEGFSPARHHPLVHRRQKVRKTFHFKAWRLDITSVLASSPVEETKGAPSRNTKWTDAMQSNEVELELDGYFLKRNLDAKLAGGRHMLWELLSDFMFAARDLAALACELSPMSLPPVLPAPSVQDLQVDDDDREALKRKFETDATPLIGHYLYRLSRPEGLAEARAAGREQPAAKAPRPG